MGLGRRAFLKFAATALGGLAVDPATAIAVTGDYYVNTRLGLAFMRPQGWQLQTFQDFATQLKGQIVEGVEPEEEEAFRRDQASTLVATISKYDDSVDRFSPSITVFKNTEDRAGVESLDTLAGQAIAAFSECLKDYAVTEPPLRRELSNCDGLRFKSRWVFQHEKIAPVLIDDEVLVIDQGLVIYTIHLYDTPYEGDSAAEEFSLFRRSLRLA
jgi:hypothetical protein